jgi:predicted lipid-binding transport protein (Tim44 family)
MKRIFALTVACMLIFSSIGFAAVSSSRTKSFSAPKSSTTTPSTQTSPQSSTDYKPSAPASSYSTTTPAKVATQPGTQPATGGFLRNAALLGGGMLLGGMLGSMFGFGNMGFLSTILGILINVMLVVGVVMGIRYLWNKFKNKDKERKNIY